MVLVTSYTAAALFHRLHRPALRQLRATIYSGLGLTAESMDLYLMVGIYNMLE